MLPWSQPNALVQIHGPQLPGLSILTLCWLVLGKGDDGRKPITRVDAGSRRVTRAQRKQQRNEAREAGRPEKEDIVEVGLEGMSVQDLADRLQVAPTEILKELFMKGIMAQVSWSSHAGQSLLICIIHCRMALQICVLLQQLYLKHL